MPGGQKWEAEKISKEERKRTCQPKHKHKSGLLIDCRTNALLIHPISREECIKTRVVARSVLLATSNLFTIDRYHLTGGNETQCLFYNYQFVGIHFYMPIFFFWTVLMSTHGIVSAPLVLMNPYNCCTNILNLIACNVVNTQLSVPIRGTVAQIIQNSGKPKIIYVRLQRSILNSGLQIHPSNHILF